MPVRPVGVEPVLRFNKEINAITWPEATYNGEENYTLLVGNQTAAMQVPTETKIF